MISKFVISVAFCRYEKQSKSIGKGSFSYAWVTDEHEDERKRGTTVEFTVKQFETKKNRITIYDSPGHADFIPNMLNAAMQADIALIMIDVNQFTNGFFSGQTKEHAQLIRALGINNIIIAINKMDEVKWSKDCYFEICETLKVWLTGPEARFPSRSLHFVPISAFYGENITTSINGEFKEVMSLIDVIESVAEKLSDRDESESFSAVIVEVISAAPMSI